MDVSKQREAAVGRQAIKGIMHLQTLEEGDLRSLFQQPRGVRAGYCRCQWVQKWVELKYPVNPSLAL